MLSPYDLGNLLVAENCFKINIDELVSNAQKELKSKLVEAQIEAFGIPIALTTSKTKFGGLRIWFVCPNCGRRVGTIFKHSIEEKIGCRICLNLKYRKQRFKGMIETCL